TSPAHVAAGAPTRALDPTEQQPACGPLRDGQGLAVPPHAAGQRPAAGSGGVRVAELSLDAPIVRQIQGAPAGIVERPFLSAGDVAQVESPSAVEAEGRALALCTR